MRQPEFGRKVRKLRTSQGLTQSELAERCNLSLRTVQRIENSETMPRGYTVGIILETLGSESGISKKAGWIDSLLNNVQELFNLKHNTMKKLSVLTLFTAVLFAGIFLFTQTSNAQRRVQESLIGVWQQVVVADNGEITSYIPFIKIFNADSTYVHMRASGNSPAYFNAVGKWEVTANDTFLEHVEPTPASICRNAPKSRNSLSNAAPTE